MTSRERNLLIGGGIIVAGVLIWHFLVPTDTGPKKVLLSVDQANQKREVQLRTLRRLNNEMEEMKPRVQKMAYQLPAEQLVPRIIRDLQATAKRANIHLREIKPLRPRLMASGQGARVPMEVRFRSTFQPNTMRFLYYLEDPDGKMVVEKLNVTSADSQFKTVDVSAQVTVFTNNSTGVTGGEGGDTTNANTTKKS